VGVHSRLPRLASSLLTVFLGVVRSDRARLRHRMADGFDQAFHAIINLFFDSAVAAFGALYPLFRAHRDGFGGSCMPIRFDLWRRGTAHADVSGSAQRILADCVDFDAGAVCAVHVRTGLCAGEPAHDEAGS